MLINLIYHAACSPPSTAELDEEPTAALDPFYPTGLSMWETGCSLVPWPKDSLDPESWEKPAPVFLQPQPTEGICCDSYRVGILPKGRRP